MSLNASTPTPRDTGSELSNAYSSGQQTLGFENQASQQGTQIQLGAAQSALGFYPGLNTAQNTGNSQTRQSTLGDLTTLGAGYTGALTSASPLLGAAQNRLTSMVGTAGNADPMLQQLNNTTLSNLQLGGGLSDQQIRDATQTTRQGLASRGMAMGNNAIGAEVLGRDQYSQQLQNNRIQQAQGVESQNLQQQQQGQNFALGANQAGQTLANTGLGMLTGTQGVSVNGLTNFVNPYASLNYGLQNNASLLGYANDVNSTNFNAATDISRTNANNQAALYGAMIGTTGKMGGDYLGTF